MKKLYRIKGTTKNETDPLTGERCYWSNFFGWVTKGFDLFTTEEKLLLNLPIGGKWEVCHEKI